jgi:environmental stress-induced protein Ves
MPWKNGGGETIEIAIFPDGATLETFDWRISMATVSSDGPFSDFAHIDRTLSVLSGEGLALKIGRMTYQLTPESPPLSFAGDVPTSGTLVSGPIIDLNVMSRRGTCAHSVERFQNVETVSIACDSDHVFVLPLAPVTVSLADEQIELSARDCVWFSQSLEPLVVTATHPVTLFLIRIVKPE